MDWNMVRDYATIVKNILEGLYYVAGIFLVYGIIIGMKQLKLVKDQVEMLKDEARRAKESFQLSNQRSSVEKSIEYLDFYKSSIMPSTHSFRSKINQELPKRTSTSHLFDGNFILTSADLNKDIVAESIVAQRSGVIDVFNHFEHFAVAMLHGVADEQIVFTPIGRLYCEFIEEEHVSLSLIRSKGVPYRNLIELYKLWSDRLEVEQLELQKFEAEIKIKEKGNSYKARPYIGS